MNDQNGTPCSSASGGQLLRTFAAVFIGILVTAACLGAASHFSHASKGSPWQDPAVQSQLVELRPTVPFGWPH